MGVSSISNLIGVESLDAAETLRSDVGGSFGSFFCVNEISLCCQEWMQLQLQRELQE